MAVDQAMRITLLAVAIIVIIAVVGVQAQQSPISGEVELKNTLNTLCANSTGPALEKCQEFAGLIWQGALFAEPHELAELIQANSQPNGCSIGTGIKCAAVVAKCVISCKNGVTACLSCMGPSWNTWYN